jgi:SAM-dependent methyltransferase
VGKKPYLSIVSHYESCLQEHGDTHLGVDWPKAEDVDTRHRVMLDVIRPRPSGEVVRLLDFGCGASHLYEYIQASGIDGIQYSGLDLSRRFVDLSESKFPANTYYCVDVLDDAVDLPRFDYVVMSGVLTEKRDLSYEEMLTFARRLITKVFDVAEIGMAFNVMSKHVDWERDDLFHLPFDTLAAFLRADVSRDFVFRNDYGLYEYTAYVYR